MSVPINVCLEDTPWDMYNIQGRTAWVKREDLCCPGGPPFSKMRGLQAHLQKQDANIIGALDTIHSKAGWAVAYVCNLLEKQCINFYPGNEPKLSQIKAQKHGALIWPLRPGRSAILWHRAHKMLKQIHPFAYMMPNGLQLEESVEETKKIVSVSPRHVLGGTWLVSASTGTIAKGISEGLEGRAELIVHMGYSRSIEMMRKKVGLYTTVVDEGYAYRDSVDYPCPFPCNPWYDLKAWKWLNENINLLHDPIVFWNIGE